MIRGASLDWLNEVCSSCTGANILLYPSNGLELSFFPKCHTVSVYPSSKEEKAWIRLLITSMENLNRTGLETLFGLNKAGRRVFLYHQLRTFLDIETRSFWDAREGLIRSGLLCDAQLERMISHLNYPHGEVRWRMFGPKACSFWEKKHRYTENGAMFARLHMRKESLWCLPWRKDNLLKRMPVHEKKSIIPAIPEVNIEVGNILEGIRNAPKNSIDVFLLWDGISAVKDIWPEITRAATLDARVLVASRKEEPTCWSGLETKVVSYTSDVHFSFAQVAWIKV